MTVTPLTAQGTVPTLTAVLTSESLSSLTIVTPGANLFPGSIINVAITGGGGSGASATYVVNSAGTIAGVTPTIVAGTGYTSTPTATALQAANGGPAAISTTGALPLIAGVSIAAMTGQVTWCVEVLLLTAGKTLELALELGVSGFSGSTFGDIKQFIGQEGPGGTTYVAGAYNPNTDKRSTVVRQQLPFSAVTYFGVASQFARVNCIGIDGSAGAVINSWFET